MMAIHPFNRPFSKPIGAWGLLCALCLLVGFGAPGVAWSASVTIVPFVSTDNSNQSTYVEASTQLGNHLKEKKVKVVAADAKGQQSQFVLPFRSSFRRGMTQYKQGKALLRKKKPDASRAKLEAALKNIEKGLMHLRDFGELIELYRLLGLCYFRLGMGEEGEAVIRRLGALVPRYKFAVSKMPPAMQRVLKRAQKLAKASKYKLLLTVPSGSSLQLNKAKVDSVSGAVPIKGLAAARHYLWVRKKGYIPFAQLIRVKRGTTKLTIDLKPIPRAGGPNLSGQVASIRAQLKRAALTRSLGNSAKAIASGLNVDAVIMGYFQKAATTNDLHMFLYRKSDDTLRKFPVQSFDLELLQLTIKLVTLGDKLKASLSTMGKLPVQSWMSAVAAAPRVTPPRPAPAPRRVAVARPTPRPAGGGDDDDDDLDNPSDTDSGGFTIVRRKPPVRAKPRPAPRPVAPRPTPRPAPVVTPRPTPRPAPVVAPRPAPRPMAGGDDDDDDDTLNTTRQPRPRKRAKLPSYLNSVPDSLKKDRQALATDKKRGRRIGRLVSRAVRKSRPTRSRRRRGPFDPDKDVDWSNPIPGPNERIPVVPRGRRVAVAVPSQPRPAPVRPQPDPRVDPTPVRVTPRPEPVRREPPPSRGGWGDDLDPLDNSSSAKRRPKPPKAAAGGSVVGKWWFWTLIAGGTAAAATVIGVAVVQSQPGVAYNISVNTNPPTP